jgi:hypothetical protein
MSHIVLIKLRSINRQVLYYINVLISAVRDNIAMPDEFIVKQNCFLPPFVYGDGLLAFWRQKERIHLSFNLNRQFHLCLLSVHNNVLSVYLCL